MIASLVAALALRRLGGGVWAAVLWLVAPTMIFQVMPYTESLFCAFAFWAWYFARKDKWWAVCLLAMGAMATRVSGLFLIAGLGIMILTHREPDGPHPRRPARPDRQARGLADPAGRGVLRVHALPVRDHRELAGLAGCAAERVGARLDLAVAELPQHASGDRAGGAYPDHPGGWEWIFRFEVVSMVVGLLAVGFLIARKQWAEATWIGLQLISFSTSYWLFSVNRAVLLWFPVWTIAAELITHKYRRRSTTITVRVLTILWLIGSIGVGLWWAGMFYTHQWTS